MANRHPSRLVPSFEPVEPRVVPTGVSAPSQELLSSLQQMGFAQVFETMQLIHRMAMEQRAVSRDSRAAEQVQVIATLREQAERMREAAKWRMAAGIVSGSASIAGGAISLGSGRFVAGALEAEQAALKAKVTQHQAAVAQFTALESAMRDRLEMLAQERRDQVEMMIQANRDRLAGLRMP